MKIDDSIKKAAGLPVGTTQARGGKAAEKAGPAAAAPAGDSVTLSAQVKTISAQTSGAGVFDAGKVEEIKAAIAGGQFKVDAEKVANGLLETVSDLISARRRG